MSSPVCRVPLFLLLVTDILCCRATFSVQLWEGGGEGRGDADPGQSRGQEAESQSCQQSAQDVTGRHQSIENEESGRVIGKPDGYFEK